MALSLSGWGVSPTILKEKRVFPQKLFLQHGKMGFASVLSLSRFRSLAKSVSAILAAFACMIVSGGLRASAADTEFLSKSDTRALYGDTIPFTYVNGSTGLEENGTFTIQGVNSTYRISGGISIAGYTPNFNNWEYLLYSSAWGIDVSLAQNVTVQINPQYSIVDTETFTSFIALSTDYDVSTVYPESVWECRSSISGQVLGYSPSIDGRYSLDGFRGAGAVDKYVVCPINFSNQSSGSFSSIQCRFSGCGVSRASGMNQRLYLLVGIPRVTVGASSSSGTVPTTTEAETTASGTGGGDTYITVIVNNNNSEVVSILNDQQQQNSEYQEKMLYNDDLGEVTTIASAPVSQIQGALTAESEIWDQASGLVETSGFWLAFLGWVYGTVTGLKAVAPVFIMLSVLAYVWWRK